MMKQSLIGDEVLFFQHLLKVFKRFTFILEGQKFERLVSKRKNVQECYLFDGDVFLKEGGEVFEMRSPLFAFIQSTGVVTTITLVTTVMMIKMMVIYIEHLGQLCQQQQTKFRRCVYEIFTVLKVF